MKVVKNFLWNAGYQVFVLFIPLITIPYVNRVLGPTGIGINAYTNSIVQYFVLFGSLGINIYGNREVAYVREDMEAVSQKFWEISLLKICTVGIATIAYLVFIFFSPNYKMFYIAQIFFLVGAALDISWFFQGLEEFRITVVRNIIVKLISLVCVFIFVKHATDTGTYILILSGSQAVGFLTLWPYLKSRVQVIKSIKSVDILQHAKASINLLVPQLATQIYLQLNKTMLGSIKGVEASGFYDNSDKIIKVLLAIVTATGTVLLPHVANSFARGDRKAVNKSLEISMHVILVMAIPLAFGIAAVSGMFTVIFFGKEFNPVSSLMVLESMVVIIIGISNAIGIQYLLPTNQVKSYTLSVTFGSVVNVFLNVPFIFMFGAKGAVVATVISEAVVTGYQMYKVRHQLKFSVLFSESGKYVIAGIVMFCVLKIAQISQPDSLVWLVFNIILGVAVYAVTLIALKPKKLFEYSRLFNH